MRLVVFAGLGVALAGCAVMGLGKGPPATASLPAAASDVPWQVAPSTEPTGKAHEDVPRFSLVEGWGLVLATPRVLASFPDELASTPGPNRTFGECRRQIALGAARYGKATVEAASLGPERRSGRGLYEGFAEIRIVYDFDTYYEVRQATLKCYSRRDGSIVHVEVVFPTAADGTDV
jgi:hypothetical protein